MDSPIVSVREVRKRFASVVAVAGVSFDVPRGEILALLGPNGAGKTTIVRMIIGIFRPDSGSIRFELEPGRPAGAAPRSRIGYLPEERGLYPDIPVLRTLTHFGVLRGLRRDRAAAAAGNWLERIGLRERANARLETLSKGNQQLVQLAAALIHGPALAVLDEPFSGLDPVNQERVLDLLSALKKEGATILLSAHQMDLVERAADRIVLMDHGRLLASGDLQGLRQEIAGGEPARLHDLFLRAVRATGVPANEFPPVAPPAAAAPGESPGGAPRS